MDLFCLYYIVNGACAVFEMEVSVRGRRKCSWVSKDVEPPCESFSCSLTKAYQRILMALGVKRGGYALDFADPPEELVCMICHHVAKEAHQVECCGKVFCETCIKAHEADAVSNKEK